MVSGQLVPSADRLQAFILLKGWPLANCETSRAYDSMEWKHSGGPMSNGWQKECLCLRLASFTILLCTVALQTLPLVWPLEQLEEH